MTTFEHPTLASMAVQLAEADRRRETRYSIPEGVKVDLCATSSAELIEAEVSNLSKNGFGLLTDRYLAPRTTVSFSFGLKRIYASVRHCRAAGRGFEVGLLIDAVIENPGEAGPLVTI